MGEQEKPFKTIEVIDNDTKQVCKIACMSCIRGHRTTSCGIPVCRTKIFWTVKRPGRPSNSCTCRFHSSGVCKCVTAIPKCPHKPKKGEKRTGECRCDEQGRFCCLLEPEHWSSLMQLLKPSVQFFASREALEAWQTTQSVAGTPAPSSYTMTPQPRGSCCGSATTQGTPRLSMSMAPSPPESTMSPQSRTIAPRPGFMDNGALNYTSATDVMSWNGDLPTGPQDYHSPQSMQPEEMVQSSCCQSVSYTPPASHGYAESAYQPAFTDTYPYSDAPMLSPPAFDFDRWNQNYQMYQFPNAICQNCGLNGCTCRSCPPLMQNFQNTSWAQSCGRRHARLPAIAPAPPQQHHSMSHMQPQPQHAPMPHAHLVSQHDQIAHMQHVPLHNDETAPIHHNHLPHAQSLPIHGLQPPLATYDPHLILPEPPDPLEYSDFLMHELDRPSHVPDEHIYGE